MIITCLVDGLIDSIIRLVDTSNFWIGLVVHIHARKQVSAGTIRHVCRTWGGVG